MIRNLSKADRLKNRLLDDIRRGVYRPGDALPSLRSLAVRYEMSKHTVSQALSNLNELKVVEIAHGKTTRLRSNPFRKHIEIVYFGLGSVESQDFWSEFYRGLSEEAERYGEFRLSQTNSSCSQDGLRIEHFDPSGTCGMIVLGTSFREVFNELKKFGVPLLSLYNFNRESAVPFVTAKLEPAIDRAVERFRKRGCRRVAFLDLHPELHGRSRTDGIDQSKYEYAAKTMASAGIMPEDAFSFRLSRPDGSYELLRRLAAEGRIPDGLFLSSDQLALGVYRAAYELKLRIPEELPVLGCDNLPGSRLMVPSLSSIELNRAELGRTAFRRLAEFEMHGTPFCTVEYPAELVLRESF
ncbi:MAG: GntR family transcriptional regulator [Lentisphaeria bacterium]|nr:GntR family transcriptional regulator [Lentisphaeria bacterium]